MILDADLTVPPEDLPRFYEALVSGRGEFINGVRLVYPWKTGQCVFPIWSAISCSALLFAGPWANLLKILFAGPRFCGKPRTRSSPPIGHTSDTRTRLEILILYLEPRLNLHILDLPIRYRERRTGQRTSNAGDMDCCCLGWHWCLHYDLNLCEAVGSRP